MTLDMNLSENLSGKVIVGLSTRSLLISFIFTRLVAFHEDLSNSGKHQLKSVLHDRGRDFAMNIPSLKAFNPLERQLVWSLISHFTID